MRSMRRADRAVDDDEARRILEEGEYGVLSTAGPDHQPYGVPVNYCVIDDGIYFHSATENSAPVRGYHGRGVHQNA